MIDLPTPETDAVAEKNIYGVACKVDVDFARKLERERDELQDALEHAVYAWESRWKAEVEFAYRVSIKRDELLDILRKLLEIIPEPECHDFGHTKEERHAFLEECPVMARYDALIAQAKEAAK